MKRTGCFVMFLTALFAVGFLLAGLYELQQKKFAEGIAQDLARVTEKQAEALDKAQDVQLLLAKLAYIDKQEDIKTQRTAQWLNIALTFAVLFLVFVAASLLFYARPHLAADAKRLRGKPKGGE